MVRTLRIYPSAVPTIAQCPAAAYAPEGVATTEQSGPAARIGSAVHALAARIVEDGLQTAPDAIAYAVDAGVGDSEGRVQMLAVYAAREWATLRDEFDPDEVRTETYVTRETQKKGTEITVSGILDVGGMLRDGITYGIVDWKSGVPDEDAIQQLKAYAWALLADARIQRVTLYLRWLGSEPVEDLSYDREEIEAWADSLFYRIASWDGQSFRAGPGCRYCRRATDCPGRAHYLINSVAAFGHGPLRTSDRASLAVDDPRRLEIEHRLVAAYDQSKALEGHISAFQANLRAEIQLHGPMQIPGQPDKVLDVVPVRGGLAIDAAKAWATIREALGLPIDADVDEAETAFRGLFSVTSTALSKEVKARAARGDKQAAVDALLEKLEARREAYRKPGHSQFRVRKAEAPALVEAVSGDAVEEDGQ